MAPSPYNSAWYMFLLSWGNLTLSVWSALVVWSILLGLSQYFSRRAEYLSRHSSRLVIQNREALQSFSSVRQVGAITLAGAFMIYGSWVLERFVHWTLFVYIVYPFLAGGLIAAQAFVLGLSIYVWLEIRNANSPRAPDVTGQMRPSHVLQQLSYRFAGAFVSCFALALAMRNLPLLGGAYFLGSWSFAMGRRARKARKDESIGRDAEIAAAK